jgi:hypothetical protein
MTHPRVFGGQRGGIAQPEGNLKAFSGKKGVPFLSINRKFHLKEMYVLDYQRFGNLGYGLTFNIVSLILILPKKSACHMLFLSFKNDVLPNKAF